MGKPVDSISCIPWSNPSHLRRWGTTPNALPQDDPVFATVGYGNECTANWHAHSWRPTERSFQLRSEDQLELLERHKRTWLPYSKTCSHGRAASDAPSDGRSRTSTIYAPSFTDELITRAVIESTIFAAVIGRPILMTFIIIYNHHDMAFGDWFIRAIRDHEGVPLFWQLVIRRSVKRNELDG